MKLHAYRHPVIFTARDSIRRPGLRWHAALWLAVLFGGILTSESLPPAQAQQGHVHHWTAYLPPVVNIRAVHIGGQRVTETFPAYP